MLIGVTGNFGGKERKIFKDIIRIKYLLQAQFNDISIVAYPDQGCVVTVQDSRGSRPAVR